MTTINFGLYQLPRTGNFLYRDVALCAQPEVSARARAQRPHARFPSSLKRAIRCDSAHELDNDHHVFQSAIEHAEHV